MSDETKPAQEPVSDEVQACTIHPVPPAMERRSFLVWIATAALALGGVFMGATVVQALMPPGRSIDGKTKVGKLSVGKVADLRVDTPVAVEYGDDALFLVKKSDTKVEVLSQACPHVGCKLHFNEASKEFDCPCHASSFSIDGVRLGGPAPRNMYGANFELVNGEIVVSGVQSA